MDRTVRTRIDQERCTGCGLCVEVCPSDTITMKGKKASVTGAESLNCGHCAAVCPSGAVQVTGLDPTLSTFKTFEARESWLHVLGLGTCLIGFAIEAMRRDKSILRRIGMPDDERAYAVIALGYPNEMYKRVAGRKQALIRYFE